MSRGASVALAATLAFASPSRVHAGSASDWDAAFFGGTPAARASCQALLSKPPPSPPPPSPPAPSSAAQLPVCLQLLRDALSPPHALANSVANPDGGDTAPTAAVRHRRLLQTYRAIEQITPWVRWTSTHTDAPPLELALATLEADAREALQVHGLLGAAYGAAVTGGMIFAEPGSQSGLALGAGTHGVRSPFFRVDLETRGLPLALGWDASAGLQVGWQPILAMVVATDVVEPAYRNGFHVSHALRFAKASRFLETAVAGRIGATRLDLGPALLNDGGRSDVFAVASNDINEWALFFDASLDLRWYDRDAHVARMTMQTLNPLVRAFVGIRHDERFHRAGHLQDFDDPTGRVFFGFTAHPIRLGAGRTTGSGTPGLTAGGGFEFEGALRGPERLPSGFRIFLSASLDVQEILRRGHAE